MTRRPIVERNAEFDLQKAYQWYEAQRSGLGIEFLHEVAAKFDVAAERPKSFPIIKRRTRRALLDRFPYAIFFFVQEPDVVIVGVFHSSRDPKAWGSRVQ